MQKEIKSSINHKSAKLKQKIKTYMQNIEEGAEIGTKEYLRMQKL